MHAITPATARLSEHGRGLVQERSLDGGQSVRSILRSIACETRQSANGSRHWLRAVRSRELLAPGNMRACMTVRDE
jgi:hypothetical protein